MSTALVATPPATATDARRPPLSPFREPCAPHEESTDGLKANNSLPARQASATSVLDALLEPSRMNVVTPSESLACLGEEEEDIAPSEATTPADSEAGSPWTLAASPVVSPTPEEDTSSEPSPQPQPQPPADAQEEPQSAVVPLTVAVPEETAAVDGDAGEDDEAAMDDAVMALLGLQSHAQRLSAEASPASGRPPPSRGFAPIRSSTTTSSGRRSVSPSTHHLNANSRPTSAVSGVKRPRNTSPSLRTTGGANSPGLSHYNNEYGPMPKPDGSGEPKFFCKFDGCGKGYASTDAVRKHCRQRHLEWLRRLGHGNPALYCWWKGVPENEEDDDY